MRYKGLNMKIRGDILTVFWYFLISLRATVPGLNLWGFLTPPDNGADFLAALVARCLRGALAPVDFLAVYLVLAIVTLSCEIK